MIEQNDIAKQVDILMKDELAAIRTRLCSISPKKMQEIYACSGAAYKLIQSIPMLLAYISTVEKQIKEEDFNK